jgi:hypothetical protein
VALESLQRVEFLDRHFSLPLKLKPDAFLESSSPTSLYPGNSILPYERVHFSSGQPLLVLRNLAQASRFLTEFQVFSRRFEPPAFPGCRHVRDESAFRGWRRTRD